ncbi:GLPGLI family protein [Algibacter pacificus]|uniref:GLPGLI family protein n=1 Tax=Algibacter pacificus TaxID=2599389 RepID=UPI001FE6AC2A|nr:GLPGLI family protein [Algibacter pacificus]
MIKIISFIFFVPCMLLAQEANVAKNVLLVNYTHSLQGEGAPTPFVFNGLLSANNYAALYEEDVLGNANFIEEEDSEEGVTISIKPKNNHFIFKDYKQRSIYSVERILMKPFLVRDTIALFNWKMKNEFKNIIGYSCQKATVNYRGRDYIAFFTTDVPYQTGPWKFTGLPGLILEVYSNDGHALKIVANTLEIKSVNAKIENPYLDKKTITWDMFTDEYEKKYNELLHFRAPDGGTMTIPKRGIETYIK